MFGLLKRLFSCKKAEIPETMYPELYWELPLSSDVAIFPPADSEDFIITYEDTSCDLTVLKPHKFVWQEMPSKIFGNFVLDADIEFPKNLGGNVAAADFAAGFVFRMSNNSTFMFLGISNQGNIRLDALINGEPRALTGWVACPWLTDKLCNIILVARDDHFTVYTNGKFALEAEDDTVRDGLFAISMQVFSTKPPVTVRFRNMSIESRPLEVEVAYSRFTNMLANNYPDQRRRLVDSFMSVGAWIPALIQIKRIEESGVLLPIDRFHRAECCIRANLYDEAKHELEQIPEDYERYEDVQMELFHVLYITGAYEALKTRVLACGAFDNPQHCNALGHAYFNLGNFENALSWYQKAFSLEPTMPLYAMNAARSAEHAGHHEEAMRLWYEAAGLFYDQEAYEDTRTCLKHLRELGAESHFALSIEGRMAYAEGNIRLAETCLRKLEQGGQLDPGSAYLLGMIRSEQNNREQALEYFKTALLADQDNPLYHFRYTESLWLSGKAYEDALAAALPYAERCGWIYNLAGLIALEHNAVDNAIENFRNAVRCLPEEASPVLNLVDALCRNGSFDEAKTILSNQPESAEFLNAFGNVCATNNAENEALVYYNRALEEADKGSVVFLDILYNRASCYAKLEQWGDAQDDLRRVLAYDPDDIRALALTGDIWEMLGDPVRAELSWLHAIQVEPDNLAILEQLGRHYIQYSKQKKLSTIVNTLEKIQATALAGALLEAWDNKLYTTLACSTCTRTWKVPKTLPVSNLPLRLHGELPDELPAGMCPQCLTFHCIGCVKEHVVEGRFVCPKCGTRLSAAGAEIRYIYREWLKNSTEQP